MFNGGVEYNEDTEWYETAFRQYDPAIGRFGGIDPLTHSINGINPYQFAYNNPVMMNDPTGLMPDGSNIPLPMGTPRQGESTNFGGGGSGWFRGFRIPGVNTGSFGGDRMGWNRGTAYNSNGSFYDPYANLWDDRVAASEAAESGDAAILQAYSAKYGTTLPERYHGLDITIKNGEFGAWIDRNIITSELIDIGGRLTVGLSFGVVTKFHKLDLTLEEQGYGSDRWAYVPVVGSARDAYYQFQQGNVDMGLFHTVMAISDVTGLKSLATIAVKGVGKLVAKKAARRAGSAYDGVRAASSYLQKAGVPRAYRKQILQSFNVETISLRTADNSTFGLRFYGGGANASGRYLFPTFTNYTNRAGLALPYKWNGMTGLSQFQIRPGSTYIFGRAASQGGRFTGGSYQMYVNDLGNLIR